MGSPRKISFAELEPYESDITVSAAVNHIIDAVSSCNWEIVPDDPFSGLNVDSATEFFKAKTWDVSFDELLRGITQDILHYDCGTIVISFPEWCYDENKNLIRTDIPVSLRARDGRSFIKQVDIYGDIIKYWQYSFLRQSQAPIEFTKDEIIYLQERPSTRSPYGISKLETVKNVADLMLATQKGHRAEQENNMSIGGVIQHENINDPARLKQLATLYNSKLSGESNKSKWVVVGSGVSVNPINASISDNTWIDGSRYYQEAILAIFKVPKSILGMTTDVNRSTSETQNDHFKTNGVATVLSLIEGILTREIVKKYFDSGLSFKFTREIDLKDQKIRAEIDTLNINSRIITSDEIRIRDGKKALNEKPESITESIEKRVHDPNHIEERAVQDLLNWSQDYEKEIEKELRALYD